MTIVNLRPKAHQGVDSDQTRIYTLLNERSSSPQSPYKTNRSRIISLQDLKGNKTRVAKSFLPIATICAEQQ